MTDSRLHDWRLTDFSDWPWTSGRPGRPKDLDVRKTWTSGRPGRPEDLDVQKTWMSGDLDVQRPGRTEDLDVRKTWTSGDLDVQGLGRPENLDVLGPGCPGTWTSWDLDVQGPGCPGPGCLSALCNSIHCVRHLLMDSFWPKTKPLKYLAPHVLFNFA